MVGSIRGPGSRIRLQPRPSRLALPLPTPQRILGLELGNLQYQQFELALDQVEVGTVNAVSRIGSNLRQFAFDHRTGWHRILPSTWNAFVATRGFAQHQ
jgi:hypothetical protein